MTLRTMRCSFCNRRHTEVEQLVAGPRRLLSSVYICNRCAYHTVAIMQAAAAQDAAAKRPSDPP